MMENLVVAKIKAGWNWQGKHSPLFSEMFEVKNSAERSNLPNGLYFSKTNERGLFTKYM